MANIASLDLELSSSQYAYAADSASLSITGDLTIEAWVKLEQLPSTAGSSFMLVSKYDYTDGQRSYFLSITTADKLECTYYGAVDGSTYEDALTNSAVFTAGDVGNWVHVAVTVDVSAKTFVFYKNLATQANTVTEGGAGATSIVDSTARFIVGAANWGAIASYFDGLIDEVRLWSDIRTSDELTAYWKTELAGNEANLNAYYKFNNDYTDSTSGGNTLTASGSPVFSSSIPFGISNNYSFFM